MGCELEGELDGRERVEMERGSEWHEREWGVKVECEGDREWGVRGRVGWKRDRDGCER